jgi:6-phosphogluconate dehydrogenase
MSAGGNDIGLFGLAVMGRNLVLNMADKGFAVAAYNRTQSVTEEFASGLEAGKQIQPCYSLEEFIGSLKRPRVAMLMVKAGKPVDAVIAELEPLLEPGDIIVDGGNSHFTDTERRARALEAKGIHFLGVGISGGEAGARHGPSMMPGGPEKAYAVVQPIFEATAAKADGEPCVAYLGPGASGHYVKMVHNGIEYGIMQLIAETYALMKEGHALDNELLAEVYARWADAELESYLVEITADIFRRLDEETGRYVIDLVLGEAEQLGTGMWASQSALDLHVPVPNIDIAVTMRNLSSLVQERRDAGDLLRSAKRVAGTGLSRPSSAEAIQAADDVAIENVRSALYAGVILTYAQGFAQLQTASRVMGFALDLAKVAAVWRGGCIIRSVLLRDIKAVFLRSKDLSNLMLDPELAQDVVSRREALVSTIEAAASAGIPVPGLTTALAYLDAYRAEWLPFNLIQAQRDYFGAHTYRRVDKEGVFHTDWLAPQTGMG